MIVLWFIRMSTSVEKAELTVMIKHETGQPLDDSTESSGFLRINEGLFLGHVRTRPVFGQAQKYQGLYSSPTVKLLWLSESVKAYSPVASFVALSPP